MGMATVMGMATDMATENMAMESTVTVNMVTVGTAMVRKKTGRKKKPTKYYIKIQSVSLHRKTGHLTKYGGCKVPKMVSGGGVSLYLKIT